MRETIRSEVLDVTRPEPICVRVTLTWLVAIGFLVAMHWAGILTHLRLGEDHFVPRQLLKLFYMDAEGNVPAWFSSCMLWTCSLLLIATGFVARDRGQGSGSSWLVLGGVFAALSMDESVALHEWAITPMRELSGGGGGFLYFGWILPGAIATSVVGLSYVPFLVRLPAPTRVFFVVGGAVYVLGAIGLESIGGYLTSPEGASVSPWVYRVTMSLEESFELLGLTIFIHGLTTHLAALLRTPAGVGRRNLRDRPGDTLGELQTVWRTKRADSLASPFEAPERIVQIVESVLEGEPLEKDD